MKMKRTRILAEAALMVAAAAVLSVIQLPGPWVNGGSITLCSMLPICVVSFRHGIKWGLLSGFAFGILQMMFGISGLRGISLTTFVLSVLMDYLLAFTVLGLAGIFRNRIAKPSISFAAGASVAIFLRFLCHFISGCVVWDSLVTVEGIHWAGILYSLQYNASYMLPEWIITVAVGIVLCRMVDLRAERIAYR